MSTRTSRGVVSYRPQAQPYNALTPGTFPSAGQSTLGMDTGSLTNSACSFITDSRLRALCIAAGSVLLPGSGGGNSGGGSGGTDLVAVTPCPPGYKRNSAGACQLEGIGPYIPGDVGRADFGWEPALGRYGVGYSPIAVARNPTRVCPPGAKLGKDGLCYDKLARSNRLWDPGAKPFLTGGQVQTIRKAKALQKRGRRLMTQLMPAAKRCGPPKKRRK